MFLISTLQAEPLFKDRSKFSLMADPLLEGKFPLKSLYQALAVAAMCLQEEAETRPLMGDVVTALEYLSTTKTDYQNATNASDYSSCGHVTSLRRGSISGDQEL